MSAAASRPAAAEYDGPIVDCDVHAEPSSPDEILPYLPSEWSLDYLRQAGRTGPAKLMRPDAAPESGGPAGSAPELVHTQLLEPLGIDRAVLSPGTLVYAPSSPNPYYAAAMARAANDWLIDRWLGDETPFYGSILVANHLPEVAAAEIRRAGQHPRMVCVVMADNALGHPWGHALFHPIYEAAAELGLPVAIQAGGFGGVNPSPTGGGPPSLDLEQGTLAVQGAMNALVTFITEGVFDHYPSLKLILLEGGVAWLPGLLWRFDASFKGARREVPWVKRLPSEYFRDHVRITTQPPEIPPGYEHIVELLAEVGAQETLMFASDYPHRSEGEPLDIAARIPAAWLPNVLRGNALATFRWPERGN
ncbi:MAG: uncharacterized protein QOH58_1813 [Thermoleophilaceae bacterium]|nr:uncharacterized protein [Thermoleophilaceae bacterium]